MFLGYSHVIVICLSQALMYMGKLYRLMALQKDPDSSKLWDLTDMVSSAS